jgi:hypothetical protein
LHISGLASEKSLSEGRIREVGLAEHMPTDRGSRADWGEIYGGFLAWQKERGGEVAPCCVISASRPVFASGDAVTGFTAWTAA